MPFGYYNLPFCRPEEGVRDSAENLSELLLGDRIENSPYRFRMYTNESDLVLCRTDPLSPAQLAVLRQRIDEMYQVNLILDNLPAIRYTHKDEFALRWTGYPVGIRVQDVYYLFNHLKFKVLVHRYEETDVACVIGTGDTEAIYVLYGDDGALKLPYCITVAGFVCAMFAFGIPHLSVLRVWLGFSTFLSLIYIVLAFVLSLKDDNYYLLVSHLTESHLLFGYHAF